MGYDEFCLESHDDDDSDYDYEILCAEKTKFSESNWEIASHHLLPSTFLAN